MNKLSVLIIDSSEVQSGAVDTFHLAKASLFEKIDDGNRKSGGENLQKLQI